MHKPFPSETAPSISFTQSLVTFPSTGIPTRSDPGCISRCTARFWRSVETLILKRLWTLDFGLGGFALDGDAHVRRDPRDPVDRPAQLHVHPRAPQRRH